jgi:hypothetical protein
MPYSPKRADTSVVLIVIKWCPLKSAIILLPIRTVIQHESDTRKNIAWSVTVYNKSLYNECNVTAQIEPVQDKLEYVRHFNHQSKSF